MGIYGISSSWSSSNMESINFAESGWPLVITRTTSTRWPLNICISCYIEFPICTDRAWWTCTSLCLWVLRYWKIFCCSCWIVNSPLNSWIRPAAMPARIIKTVYHTMPRVSVRYVWVKPSYAFPVHSLSLFWIVEAPGIKFLNLDDKWSPRIDEIASQFPSISILWSDTTLSSVFLMLSTLSFPNPTAWSRNASHLNIGKIYLVDHWYSWEIQRWILHSLSKK